MFLISSMQIVLAQASGVSLLPSASVHPCPMSASVDGGNSNSASSHTEPCTYCSGITSYCQSNGIVDSFTGIDEINANKELEIKHNDAFYAYITFPSGISQQPQLKPPRL